MKKMLLVLFAVLIACGVAFGAGTEEAADTGPTTIAVQVGFQAVQSAADWDNYFWTRFVEQKFNVELDITAFETSVAAERMNIALAAGELADLLVGAAVWSIRNQAIPTGQFLPLRERMENGSGWVNHPLWDQLRVVSTEPDGEIYVTSRGNANIGGYNHGGRYFWYKPLVEQVTDEWPITTLDQATDVLYDIKDLNPDLYPISGRWQNRRITNFFINAFGMMNGWAGGLESFINIVDGEVVLSYVHPNFPAYLEYMAQIYEDGLIDPEFFTHSMGQLRAKASENPFALVSDGAAHVLIGSVPDALNYHHVTPLTSDFNDEAWWPITTPFANTGFAIASYSENADKTFEIVDWHGTPEATFMQEGYIDEAWLEGLDIDALIPNGLSRGNIISERGDDGYLEMAAVPEGEAPWNFHNTAIWPRGSNMPFIRVPDADYYEAVIGPEELDPTVPAEWFHYNNNQVLPPYLTREFTPRDIKYTPEELEVVNQYMTELEAFVDEMHSKFIIGVEPLSAYEDFVADLDRFGLQELTEVWQAAYDRWAALQ